MFDMVELLKKRHSVREYSNETVPTSIIKEVLLAGLYAPSGRGIYPVKFIVVNDKNLLQKLSACKNKSSQMLANANCAIVVIADASKSDMVIEDSVVAMTIMHLTATSLGIGSCWVHCRNRNTKEGIETEQYIRELVSIPPNYMVEAILSIGISLSEKTDFHEKEIDFSKVYLNSFGQEYE